MATIDINTRKSEAADKGDLVDDASATMNTWCKYTVNSSDVYTLYEVSKNYADGDDVGQSHDDGSKTTGRVEIDKSHISLSGSGDIKRVYGNDESVYLVAETDLIDSDTNYNYHDGKKNVYTDDAAIIDDVASVVTGVENADIEVFDKTEVEALYTSKPAAAGDIQVATEKDSTTKTYANVSYGTYVLFDKESYVIGAVVVGEDAGSTNNFVYVISENANRESYSSADDEYTWTRPVALDGQEDELTYVGDALEEISKDEMDAATWQYVRYYADGTVKDAEEVPTTDTTNWKNGYDVMHSILEAVKRVDEANEEHVLLSNAVENDLTFKNGTLYSDDSDDMGIWISPDVKVVRIQNVDNDQFGEIEYYDGRDGLEDALDDMIVDEDDNILVSAIIEDGAAMVVVLNNTNDEETDEGEQVNDKVRVISDDADNDFADPTYYNPGKALTTAQENDLVYDMLREAGCTDISNNGTTFTFTKSNGRTITQTIDMTQVYAIKLTPKNDAVSLSEDTIYLGNNGDISVTISVTNNVANWDKVRTWTILDADGNTVRTASEVSGTEKVQTMTFAGHANFDEDMSCTLSWTD